MHNYNLISIIGNTATGKTKLAVKLAQKINSEIISADSRQVYKGMDIGTGKDLEEYQDIPYHLIDIKKPGYEYNVFEYQKDFFKIYNQLIKKEVTPIMCGGSGMYVDAVLRAYNLIKVPENKDLRSKLESLSKSELINKLKQNRIPHNTTDTDSKSRAIRAIEIDEYYKNNADKKPDFPKIKSLNIGVEVSREQNRKLITKRLEERLENGMIEEVESLLKQGYTAEQLKFYGLEYRYLTMYLQNEIDYKTMKNTLNTKIHQFMKRQSTWWRRMEKKGVKIYWLDANKGLEENVERIIGDWLIGN